MPALASAHRKLPVLGAAVLLLHIALMAVCLMPTPVRCEESGGFGWQDSYSYVGDPDIPAQEWDMETRDDSDFAEALSEDFVGESDDDDGYESDYSDSYGYEDDSYGYEDDSYDYEDNSYDYEDDGYGYEDDGYGYEENRGGYEDDGYGYEDDSFGYEDDGYGYEDDGYGYEDDGYGYEDDGYGYEDDDFAYQGDGYEYEDEGYGYEDDGYGFDDSYKFDDSSFYDDTTILEEEINEDYDSSYDYEVGFGSDDNYDYEDEGYEDGYGYDDFVVHRRRHGRRSGRRGSRDRRERGRRPDDDAELEFDDASAEPQDIPKGYFGRDLGPSAAAASAGRDFESMRQGGGNGATESAGRIDFPGFRLIISSPTQWWKYPRNVCLHKNSLEPTEAVGAHPATTMYTVRCRDVSPTEHTCNVTQVEGGMLSSDILTYTCCAGYTRLYGDRGCPRKILDRPTRNVTFQALLRRHGYSQKVIDLFATVLANDTTKPWTVFVPAKKAMDEALKRVELEESTAESAVPDWFVRTMLNHFAQPARPVQSLAHGQLLKTLEKSGGLLISRTWRGRVLANCQPIVKANQPFNRYSIAHFTASVLTVRRSNLYQLMMKQLEAVVSLDRARQLLAPLKPTLTGAQPVTVFMHLPSREELDSSCYARNLRSVIVSGAECNATLLSQGGDAALRTVDGKLLLIRRVSGGGGGGRVQIGSSRQLVRSDLVASNGVLHLVNATESLSGFSNEVSRKLRSVDQFKRLFANATTGKASDRAQPPLLLLLLPPLNGSHSYANSSARWRNSTELISFGRRHLVLTNATAAALRRSGRLRALDGTERSLEQLLVQQPRRSLFGAPGRLSRHRFVDCVPVTRVAKDCAGVAYLLMKRELPDTATAPDILSYLAGRENYSVAHRIVQFALANNATQLASRIRRSDAALVLLTDADMHPLTGQMLARRREPTGEQMMKLAAWFAKNFLASRRFCAIKYFNNYITVPIFRIDRRPCRSIICAFRRRLHDRLRRVRLSRDGHVTVRQGFLLPGDAF